jgi:hypothetical protein
MTWRDLVGMELSAHYQRIHLAPAVFIVFTALIVTCLRASAEAPVEDPSPLQGPHALRKRINFIATMGNQRTQSTRQGGIRLVARGRSVHRTLTLPPGAFWDEGLFRSTRRTVASLRSDSTDGIRDEQPQTPSGPHKQTLPLSTAGQHTAPKRGHRC